jgi:hypothetical protein
METLDYDYTMHTTPGKGDDSLLVKFFVGAVADDAASQLAGRPIFKDVEWIDIRIPGNRDNVVIRPLRPTDKDRFPRHYAAFKARIASEPETVGTPLDQWAWRGMTRGRVEELKHYNIRTVEQLAGAPDTVSKNFMGFHEMKLNARAYLAAAEKNAPLANLQEQLNKALLKIQEQGVELGRLTAKIQGVPFVAPTPPDPMALVAAAQQAPVTVAAQTQAAAVLKPKLKQVKRRG